MDLVVYDTASREVAKQTRRVVGLTLKEIVEQFNSPVTEEHAWAVAYLAASRLAEIQWAPEISLDSIAVTKNGSVELLKENGKINAVQDMRSVMESLGVVIYQLLDYGLSEDQERTLSQPLESLIEMMTELNSQSVDEVEVIYPNDGMGGVQGSPTSVHTRDSGITVESAGVWEEQLARVLKACELHVIEVADPIEHFGQISSGMVEEAIHTMTLQSEDTEQEKGTLGQDSQVETWKHVMEDVKKGVHLQPVLEAVDGRTGLNLSKFDNFLMSISKFDKNKLHNVELDDSGKPMFDHPLQSPLDESLPPQSFSLPYRGGRRATVADVYSTLISEIKTRPSLKPVSHRQLRPVSLSDRPLTPMESLLEEIRTPPPLKRVKRISPKRLSMSVECYRMSRSNSDLLDIPFSPNPLSLYTDAWANRNLSMSVSSLSYGGSSDGFSSSAHHTRPPYTPPPTTYTPTTSYHHPPNEHRQKSKKQGTFFQKIANKITHKDNTTFNNTKRRSSCPTLLDEAVPMVTVTPYDSTGYYNTARDVHTSIPNHHHCTSIPGPNHHHHRTSIPGPNHHHRTSIPGPNHHHRTSIPGPNHHHRTSIPGLNHHHRTSIPGPNHRTSIPGPNHHHHTFIPNHRRSIPGTNHRRSIPGTNHRRSIPSPNQYFEDEVFIADSRSPAIFQYPQPRQPSHLQRQSLSSLPRTRGPRNEKVKSWALCDDVSREKTRIEVAKEEERRSSWDVPGPCMYSRPSHSPHTLSPTGPRPHTLTRSGRPSRRLSSPLLDDSMATLSDISLQLSLYEDPSNLAEMIHVRSNVTTAEFYNLQLENRKDFKNIQDEKACFSCHKTKFSVFNPAHKCYVCQRRVCSKCGKKHSLKGPPTPPRLIALFEAAGDMTNVYLCTSCLLYVCSEAKNKKKNSKHYDC